MLRLTQAQKQTLYRDGYLHLHGLVPPAMVDDALHAINHHIGSAGLPPDMLQQFGYRSFCPELTDQSVITDVFNKPIRPIADQLLGEDATPVARSAQIAIRFPRKPASKPGSAPDSPRAHIDGFNEAADGKYVPFNLLAGVMLSDVAGSGRGNLTVWPGSHHLAEAYFREHGLPRVRDFTPPLDTIEPVEVHAAPGDVVLAHYQLCHTAGPNHSPHPRYALFFRVSKVGHDKKNLSCYTDIWQAWDGMKDIHSAAKKSSTHR